MRRYDSSSVAQPASTPSRRSFMKLVLGTAAALPLAGWLATPDGVEAAPSRTRPKTVNVTKYGARGNGQADDAPAIQRALDLAGRYANAIVYLPAGTYIVGSTLSITRPVRLIGDGMDATTILAPEGIHVLDISHTRHVEIQGITVHGAHDSSEYGFAIRTYAVENLNIHHCRFLNIPDTAVSLRNVRRAWVSNCQFETIRMSGVRLEDPDEGNANQDIWVQGNTFRNTVTSRNGGHSAIQAHHRSRHERITVEENDIASLYVGIGLDALDHSVVRNNRILGNGERGEGIAFAGSNNVVTGNTINHCYAAGILEWGVAYRDNVNNLIEHNTCWDNGQGIAIVCGEAGTVIENVTISENRCYSASADHPQNFGIQSYINPTTEFVWRNVAIVNNDLRGNAVGPMSLVPPSEARIEGNLG